MQRLTPDDFIKAAASIGCEVAAVKAVTAVESRGTGFFPDGRPIILFEAKWFHHYTDGKFDDSYPNISSPVWNKSLYKGGPHEYERFDIASSLNQEAAMLSASWGLFQIMGFNYRACGFASVWDFVAAMRESEGAQLQAFINFVKTQKLDDELRDKRWADFARVYNGAGYKANNYDTKLAAAYRRYAGQ